MDDKNFPYLDGVDIEEYLSIARLMMEDLGNKREIYIVGENGSGKTTILQAITLALKGEPEDYDDVVKRTMSYREDLAVFESKCVTDMAYRSHRMVNDVFAYGSYRNKCGLFRNDISGYSGLFTQNSDTEITYYNDPKPILNIGGQVVRELMMLITDLLNNKLKFTSDEEFHVLYNGSLNIGSLSAGISATIIWLTDLLSRLMKSQPAVKRLADYQAIVLVDRIDAGLHSTIQYSFMYKLRMAFPGIQFIVTTDSMVTILGSSVDAVIYKAYKDDDNKTQLCKSDSISFYTANIAISSPLFGMTSTTARGFVIGRDALKDPDINIWKSIKGKIAKHLNDNPCLSNIEIENKVIEVLEEELNNLKNNKNQILWSDKPDTNVFRSLLTIFTGKKMSDNYIIFGYNIIE